MANGHTRSEDLPRVNPGEDNDETLLRNFVSRLAQICDSSPGGTTVTAFAALQNPDKVLAGSTYPSPREA